MTGRFQQRRFPMTLLLCVAPALALVIPASAPAENFNFFGTFWETHQGNSFEAVGLGIPASDMQAAFDTFTDEQRELTLLDAYDVDGGVFFNFVFRTKASPTWSARWGMSSSGYQEFFDEQSAAGRCLRSLDVYRNGSNVRYAAVFKTHNCRGQRAYHGISAQEHQERFEDLAADGWDPVNVSAVTVGGERVYAAFYEKRQGGFLLRTFLTRDGLGEVNAEQAALGRRIVYMNAYTHDQNALPRFAAIWRTAPPAAKTWANFGGPQVFDLGDEMHDSGRFVRYLTAYGIGDSHRYDGAAFKPSVAPQIGGPGDLTD